MVFAKDAPFYGGGYSYSAIAITLKGAENADFGNHLLLMVMFIHGVP